MEMVQNLSFEESTKDFVGFENFFSDEIRYKN